MAPNWYGSAHQDSWVSAGLLRGEVGGGGGGGGHSEAPVEGEAAKAGAACAPHREGDQGTKLEARIAHSSQSNSDDLPVIKANDHSKSAKRW